MANRTVPAPEEPATANGKPDPPALNLPLGMRTGLYAAGRFIDQEAQARLGLRIPFDVYFQDPLVASNDPDLAC